MDAATIGELPPVYLLAYVFFGALSALGIYHLLTRENLEHRGEKTFGWICLAIVWGGAGFLTVSSLT